jgi:hypothetical protein
VDRAGADGQHLGRGVRGLGWAPKRAAGRAGVRYGRVTRAKPPGDKDPHDTLFKETFGVPEHARGVVAAVLPQALVERLDWATLRRLLRYVVRI